MDPTLWVISAWNDNGFNVNVRDPNRLKRTDFFPGLGWFIPRKLFKGELQKKWPKLHWDHWMRDDEQTKGRDALFPEVPRDYHMGVKGTFMDKKMHNQCVPGACVHVGFVTMFPFARVVWYGACGVMRSCVLCRPVQRHPNLTEAWCLARYFAAIEYNQDPKFDWASAEAEQQLRYSVKTEYLARLTADIKRGQHIRSVKELDAVTTGVAVVWCVPQGEARVLACCHTHLTTGWRHVLLRLLCLGDLARYQARMDAKYSLQLHNPKAFKPIAAYFRVWHEPQRGTPHTFARAVALEPPPHTRLCTCV